MEIVLFDYEATKKTFDIGELKDVSKIEIIILSGDETAEVYYKDSAMAWFDSSDDRVIDYYDDIYTVYDIADGTNIIDAWMKREDSYDNNWWNYVG